MVAAEYLALQAALGALAAGGLAGAAAQIRGEERGARSAGRLKWVFHRLALGGFLLLLARAADPYGVLGVLPRAARGFLGDLCTVCLVYAVAAALYLTVRSAFRVINRLPSPWYRRLVRAVCGVTLLFALALDTAVAVSLRYNRHANGAWLLYLAAAFSTLIFFFNLQSARLRGLVRGLQSSLRASPPPGGRAERRRGQEAPLLALPVHARIEAAMTRLWRLQVVGTALVAAAALLQVYVGLSLIAPLPTSPPRHHTDPDRFEWHPHDLFVFIQAGALYVMLWHGRATDRDTPVPTAVAPPPRHPSPYDPAKVHTAAGYGDAASTAAASCSAASGSLGASAAAGTTDGRGASTYAPMGGAAFVADERSWYDSADDGGYTSGASLSSVAYHSDG